MSSECNPVYKPPPPNQFRRKDQRVDCLKLGKLLTFIDLLPLYLDSED